MTKLTQEYVREHLDYNAETGELRWKVRKGGRRTEGAIGSANAAGYLTIGINRKIYRNHRIIWLWWYGYFPEGGIDHIDRDRLNNRLSNLREVSQTCNARNCKLDIRNVSGVTGVFWEDKWGKWISSVMVNYKSRHIGRHKCFVEAVAHRLAAEQCLDWGGCDNNSSAYLYMKEYVEGRGRNTNMLVI